MRRSWALRTEYWSGSWGRSRTQTFPAVGRRTPLTILMRVDLPAPLSPSRPTISFRPTLKSTFESACTLPKVMSTFSRRTTCRKLRAAGSVGAASVMRGIPVRRRQVWVGESGISSRSAARRSPGLSNITLREWGMFERASSAATRRDHERGIQIADREGAVRGGSGRYPRGPLHPPERDGELGRHRDVRRHRGLPPRARSRRTARRRRARVRRSARLSRFPLLLRGDRRAIREPDRGGSLWAGRADVHARTQPRREPPARRTAGLRQGRLVGAPARRFRAGVALPEPRR